MTGYSPSYSPPYKCEMIIMWLRSFGFLMVAPLYPYKVGIYTCTMFVNVDVMLLDIHSFCLSRNASCYNIKGLVATYVVCYFTWLTWFACCSLNRI